MKRFATAALAAFVTVTVSLGAATASAATASAADVHGRWSIAALGPAEPGRVQLHVAYDGASWDNAVALDDAGITQDRLNAPVGPVSFQIKREPGTFDCTGTAGAGSGSGEFAFVPNAAFGDALAARGFARPTASQSVRLAFAGATLAFVDRLHPSMPHASVLDLVRLMDHGVTPRYVAAYDAIGYHLDSAPELQRLIDTGATPGFIRSFQRVGYRDLSPQLAVRLASSGASAAFVERLKARGYTNLSVDDVIRLRSSGAPL